MSRARGNLAEERACEFLRNSHYSIIDRNYYSRFGEIDIIALKDEVIHFIEVKSAPLYEQAAGNITPAKLNRIIRTAELYLMQRQLDTDYVIDGVIVTPEAVEIVENITL